MRAPGLACITLLLTTRLVAHEDPRAATVALGLGGDSVIPGTRPFTATEVARERRQALTSVSLVAERRRHVGTAIRQCGAPEAFCDFYKAR